MRLNAWKMKPMRSRRSFVSFFSLSLPSSTSPIQTEPLVSPSSPASACISVDLPEPDGPMMAVKREVANSTVTPSRARTSASPLPYTLVASTARAAVARSVERRVVREWWSCVSGVVVMALTMRFWRAVRRRPSGGCAVALWALSRPRSDAVAYISRCTRVSSRSRCRRTTSVRYVDQVERPPLSVRLTAGRQAACAGRTCGCSTRCWRRCSWCSCWSATSPRPATPGSSTGMPDAFSVLLTLGVAVPYYFRRHAPLAVLLISEVVRGRC